jgi:methionine synthase II (cobalamin-independent)
VEPAVAREQLRTVVEAVDVPVIVHCCAPDVPFELIRGAGAKGVSFDFALLSEKFDDALAEAVEADTTLFAGVIPSLDPAEPRNVSVKALVDRVLALRRLGFPPARIARTVAVSPSCGLAGASPAWSRRALKLASDAARALEEVE